MAEQRYRVIKRLEAGGMAEVFIGEAQSVQGFKKKVAIKRVLPHLAENENFIGMFLDEARLGARLNHANIVSVFDIGAADGTFFIVMEYIDGVNLKKIVENLRQQGLQVPLKHAVKICMDTCRGLSYAHELVDDDDQELNIVHRDISPPNILISKRGEVKVTDFGLAKATTQLEKTDPGVVKGKFAYLSPEAARGETVDARADVFAVGVVLWEMVAGRRLFLGETDYATVKLVQKAEVPSLSRLNPEIDAEFEAVLAKSLTSDPNERYQTARDFGDALADYLFSHQLKVTSYDIADLVKQTKESDKKSSGDLSSQQSIIDKLIQEELLRFTSLDDVSSPDARPSDEDVGAQPLDAGAFENPADWFSDDADVAGALDSATSQRSSKPKWLESGVEPLLDVSEEVPLPDEPEARVSEPGEEPVKLDESPAPERPSRDLDVRPSQETVVTGSSEGGGKGGLIGLLLLLLLAGAGAAYYFLVVKPGGG